MKKLTFILAILVSCLSACNLEKEVKVDLPPFKSMLVAECYIFPNQPVELSLTQTQDYFTQRSDTAILKDLFVNDATVKIIYRGKTYPLAFNPFPNITEFKYFNYRMPDSIPYNEGEPIYLEVTDKKGRSITAQTTWLKKPVIDSVMYSFPTPTDSFTFLVVQFKDNAATKDYYRFKVKKLNADTGTRINRVVVDYQTDDAVFNGKGTFGTGRNFRRSDTAEVELFHIPFEYYRFLTTTQQAQSSNGNPFAEPAIIESNITNGIGIFTALPKDKKTVIIK
jgi:hypothetical protein